MSVKLASESSFSHHARQLGKSTDAMNKGYFGFLPADSWAPNVNLYETQTSYVVCVDLAGVDRAAIDLVVQQQRLRLKGKRAVPLKDQHRPVEDGGPRRVKVHLMEIDHGDFSREVELPADVEQEAIVASFENGLLWIDLPKK